jgi:hypothetical protein
MDLPRRHVPVVLRDLCALDVPAQRAFGHVLQRDAVAARLVANLAAHPPLLSDVAQLAYLEIDDTIRATYGYAKQRYGYGYNGVKVLNVLLAALSTLSAAPVIVASWLRKGRPTLLAAQLAWSPTRSRPAAPAAQRAWWW